MPIEFVGNPLKIYRYITGLYTFDRACLNARGDVGFPIGSIITLAGPTGCGKSTTVYSLAGMMGKHLEQSISLADFEGYDVQYLEDILTDKDYSGKVNLIQKDTTEEALKEIELTIKTDEYGIGILDSIAAISPFAEMESELGEADWGRRAKLLAKFSRRLMQYLRLNKKNVFAINHVHPNMSGFGTTTPGGQTIKYLSGVEIRMKKIEEFDDGSFVVTGKIRKNKFGIGQRVFFLFMLSGKGIHTGLTALQDCLVLEKAEKQRTIKINGESLGYMKDFIQSAHDGDDKAFQPFIKLLND